MDGEKRSACQIMHTKMKVNFVKKKSRYSTAFLQPQKTKEECKNEDLFK
jgi:hypothetical protein